LARGMNWSRSKILGLFHWGVDKCQQVYRQRAGIDGTFAWRATCTCQNHQWQPCSCRPRIIDCKSPRTPRQESEFDGSKLNSPLLSYFRSSSSVRIGNGKRAFHLLRPLPVVMVGVG
jgi:hypothetical protein